MHGHALSSGTPVDTLRHPFRSFRSLSVPPRWLAVLAVAGALAVASAFWRMESARRAQRADASIDRLKEQLLRESARPAAAEAAKGDFTNTLPVSPSIDPIVRDLQRFSSATAVSFVSLDASSREPSTRTLGRTDITVTLRGDYVKLKEVLRQLLDRYPQLLVQRVSLRRLSGPLDLEAGLQLLLLSKPLPVASGASD